MKTREMKAATLNQLAKLPVDARRDLRNLVHDRLQVISGHATLIAGPAPEPLRATAQRIVQDAGRLIQELDRLLEVPKGGGR